MTHFTGMQPGTLHKSSMGCPTSAAGGRHMWPVCCPANVANSTTKKFDLEECIQQPGAGKCRTTCCCRAARQGQSHNRGRAKGAWKVKGICSGTRIRYQPY